MNEKDILKHLSSLKEVKPGSEFRKMNREVLLNQLANSSEPRKLASFSWVRSLAVLPLQTMNRMSQPVIAVILISVFVLGGGIASIRAAQNTKPGDSLYIAKIVSERTQLALAFSEKKKAKLGLEFAGNRAKELNQVLAENKEESAREFEEVVEKLRNDFKKEISVARDRIARISTEAKKSEPAENVKTDEEIDNVETSEEDSQMFSANLEKDETGIQTSEQSDAGSGETEPEDARNDTSGEEADISKDTADSTTTPEMTESAATGTEAAKEETAKPATDPEKLLEQAGQYLKNEDYDATLSKLDEADNVFNGPDENGEVKGEAEEAATSIDDTAGEIGEVLGAQEEGDVIKENASSTNK